MHGYRNAFISYAHQNRKVAASLRKVLEPAGVDSFLAHENIEVSAKWRDRLLRELAAADVFVAVLSSAYLKSQWCIQESGIAAYKPDMLVIPLSLDGTEPPAFLGSFQSVRVVPSKLLPSTLAPAFTSIDVGKGLFNLISLVTASGNYRDAEKNFRNVMPHLAAMQKEHVIALLNAAAENDQVSDASLCVSEFIPEVLRTFPKTGPKAIRKHLKTTCKRYGVKV